MPLAYPKPKDVKKAKPHFREFADGRIVFNLDTKAGRDAYAANVRIMWERQGKRCGLQITEHCKAKQGRLALSEATFDHERGRGGGKRDDRAVDAKGRWISEAVCCWCNSQRGSRPRTDFPKFANELVP